MEFKELQAKVLEWADSHDLLHEENSEKQFLKFIEEVFEFKTEFDLNGFRFGMGDDFSYISEDLMFEMGDIIVTLIILCEQLDIDPAECLEMAYEKIKDRKGKTIDGTFVKEEDL